jgi:hypothetical protein
MWSGILPGSAHLAPFGDVRTDAAMWLDPVPSTFERSPPTLCTVSIGGVNGFSFRAGVSLGRASSRGSSMDKIDGSSEDSSSSDRCALDTASGV